MKRFIQVKNGKIIDTSLLIPHVECYLDDDGLLYVEYIDGNKTYLGKIIREEDHIEDFSKEIQK